MKILMAYLVIVKDPLGKGLVQHLPVPLLKPLGFGDLLVSRVAVEDVVISFAGRTCPDVALGVPAEKSQLSFSPETGVEGVEPDAC